MMLRRTVLCFALLSTAGAQAATSGFLLGMDYSEFGPAATQIATDSSGALYILSLCNVAVPESCVTKLSADGKTILWQNNLGFFPAAMAVDPTGGVYVVNEPSSGAPVSTFVEKLSTNGATALWRTQLGTTQGMGLSIAVDATGRVFLAGDAALNSAVNGAYAVRLNAAGVVDATFLNLPGVPTAIAVDPTGSDVVIAFSGGVARLAPDGATWVVVTFPPWAIPPGLAVAPSGDAVVYDGAHLQRIGPTGAVVFSKTIPASGPALGRLAVDGAGNAYISASGYFSQPVRNSLAPCGSVWLSVFAHDGSLLQTTYLPDATSNETFAALIAVGPNSNMFVLDEADAAFTPTQDGPFGALPSGAESPVLLHLSPNAGAPVLPLVCVGNAATFVAEIVAPGEIVTLFGNGLGPEQGIQTEATLQTPFPTQAGNVEVTFDGTPAPLLWVQDAQINLVVPWSVAGPTTEICATYNNVKTNCLAWPVGETAPGVFTVDGVHAAALNQDGTINSAANPAPSGSIVAVFATGLGPINPPQADGSLVGLPLPVNALALTLQWTPFCSGVSFQAFCPTYSDNAVYAGPAPFLIAGASQINFTAGDAIYGPSLVVQTPSGIVSSNAIQIYVAN